MEAPSKLEMKGESKEGWKWEKWLQTEPGVDVGQIEMVVGKEKAEGV